MVDNANFFSCDKFQVFSKIYISTEYAYFHIELQIHIRQLTKSTFHAEKGGNNCPVKLKLAYLA